MQSLTNTLAAAVVLLAALWIGATPSYGKPEFMKKEGKACNFCHSNLKDMKQLNDAGKYYKDHNFSLDGYTDIGKGK